MSKTPMMQQFYSIKKKYRDAILFFRVGDFYETFDADAKLVSKELDIVLTARGKGASRVALAGVPYHAVDTYVTRLIKKGYKVAICEQMEEPPAKGIVKREVVRVITAGTLIEDSLLDAKENNYLTSFLIEKSKLGIAFVDISTAEFYCTEIEDPDPISRLIMEFSRFNPKECLIPQYLLKNEELIDSLKQNFEIVLSPYEEFYFSYDHAKNTLQEHFQVSSLESFGCEDFPLALQVSGAIISYLQETQKGPVQNIQQLKTYHLTDFMYLDAASIRNLELVKNLRDGSAKGTLLQVISHTNTSMGRRLLQNWLLHPLQNLTQINERLDSVAELKSQAVLRADINDLLTQTTDLERLISRINYKRTSIKDVLGLKSSLELVPQISALLKKTISALLSRLQEALQGLPSLVQLIDDAIVSEDESSQIIKTGYNEELDTLRKSVIEGKKFIDELETKEQRRTGIKSLKVRYNKVFGYYIEVTKANLGSVPKDYMRKQTLVNAERFITPELKEYEVLVLNNQDQIDQLEKTLFDEVLNRICQKTQEIQIIANALSQLDVLTNFADLAQRHNYTRPHMTNDLTLEIVEGRHPVIEQIVMNEPFIPNDVNMDCDKNRLFLITGPNMAGKCVTGNTIIFSEKGILPIKYFFPNDQIEGKFSELKLNIIGVEGITNTSHFYYDGFKPSIKITTRRGYSIEGSLNHPVLVRTLTGEEIWKKLNDITKNDYLIINKKNDLWGADTVLNYEPPKYTKNTREYPLPTRMNEDLAYLLGLLMGDGTLTYKNCYYLTNTNQFLINIFYQLNLKLFNCEVHTKSNQKDHFISSVYLRDFFKFLGLDYVQAHQKQVPEIILKSPKPIIKAFLQGLFDTDGTADNKYGNVSYYTSSKELATQVHIILLNFGIISSLKGKETYRRINYQVRITGLDSIRFHEQIGFRLPKKTKRRILASSTRMTNIDSIPYLFGLLKKMQKRILENSERIPQYDKLKYNKKIGGIFYSFIRQKRNISYHKLENLIAYCKKYQINYQELSKFMENYYFYDKVVEIESSKAALFDFSVPKGHAFVGNGFLNHNSTLLRQIALICLLAQIGSFIPAKSAKLGMVDRIFTRIGAVDDLTRRQSTFMVEMIETGTILNQATKRSLIILDEIGRGTATFDGLSIAWAVAEYIHEIGAKTLFATHYHELTELVNFLPGAKNFNIAVAESHGKIHFLRKLEPGSTSKSYGIQVARLAGLPSSVIERAKDILTQIERQSQFQLSGEKITRKIKKIPKPQDKKSAKQKTLFDV